MVNQAEGTEQLYVEIPPALKKLVDEDDRTNKELVIAALERELNVSAEDSLAVIDRKVKRLEDRLEAEKQTLEHKRDQLQATREKLESFRELREQQAETSQSYEAALDDVLDELEGDGLDHIFATHGRLDELRGTFDRPVEEIHLDLQQRAAEQDRDLSVAHFKQAYHASDEDARTRIADKWGDADE